MKTVYVNQKPVRLDAASLLQAGGEGMVFALNDRAALKLYHQPGPERAAKLEAMLACYAVSLPDTVLAPRLLARDRSGQIVGFQMARLPANAEPLKKLSYLQGKQRMHLETRQIVALFLRLHQALSRLHRLGLVVGDLNDHNIFVTPGPDSSPYWLDVDSYQFANFPCPVALLTCLDPHLYHVKDFSSRPEFSRSTDWYAYFVLLIKTLLRVHPYGGAHGVNKSLQSRAAAGISILHADVVLPKQSKPVESLSDGLLRHMERVFTHGKRPPFPQDLLRQYGQSLTTCRQCGLDYSSERSSCPACHRRTAHVRPAPIVGPQQLRLILETDGEIEHVAVRPDGRVVIIVQSDGRYELVQAGVGGAFARQYLFEGHGAYRFGWFDDHIVINSIGQNRLLLLGMSSGQPEQVTMQETGSFLGEAIFAATNKALYRLAGSYVMRGIVRDGLYIENVIATARPQQTQLWSSDYRDVIAGSVRIFTEHHCFAWSDGSAHFSIVLTAGSPGESLEAMTALSGKSHTGILTRLKRRGQQIARYRVFDRRGRLICDDEYRAYNAPHDRLSGKALIGADLYHPIDGGIVRRKGSALKSVLVSDVLSATDTLYAHPAGLLIRQQHNVFMAVFAQMHKNA